MMRRLMAVGVLVGLVALLLAGCGADPSSAPPAGDGQAQGPTMTVYRSPT